MFNSTTLFCKQLFFAIEQCALQLMILSTIYEIIYTNILLSMNKTDSLNRDIIHKYNDLTERVTEIYSALYFGE